MTVSIRRARADDAVFLVSLTTHDNVDPFLAAGRDRISEAMAADIARSEGTPEEFGVFVIEADGDLVGTMRFELVNRRSRIAELRTRIKLSFVVGAGWVRAMQGRRERE